MRILVAAPPKTGNVWLEKLLSLAFGLEWIRSAPPFDYWGARDVSPLSDFIASGQFPDHAICHQHYWPSDALFEIADQHGIALATTLRDPYDQFVSWYFYIQNFSEAFVAADDPGQRAIGKPIDDPAVLSLLAEEFGAFLDQGLAWLDSGRTFVVRYERLHTAPEAVMKEAEATFDLRLVRPPSEALSGSSAENMRSQDANLQRHIRVGRSDAGREHLRPPHLDIFRERHAGRVRRLGYPVR